MTSRFQSQSLLFQFLLQNLLEKESMEKVVPFLSNLPFGDPTFFRLLKEGQKNEKKDLHKKIALFLLKRAPFDENIFYFLLRKRYDLSLIVGPKAILRLFQTKFPEGKHEAFNFLSIRFSERGFTDIIQQIKIELDGLYNAK